MTDKPELSWYPTTIDELQRLLDSGVWPRVRAIADDVGPLQIAQGRLTYIDTPKLGGMSGILREGSAPAGADPFDLTARSLWLWRAEATEPAKREHTMVIRLDKPPRFEPEQGASIEEALVKLERLIDGVRSWPEHVRWLDIAGPIRSWCAEIRCSGTRDLTLVAAVYDAVGKLALYVDQLDHVRVANAAGSIAREAAGKYSNDALATVKLRAALTAAASSMARFPGPTPEEIKEPELDMPPSVAGVDFCVVELDGGGWRMEASCDDPGGPLGPECVVRGEERDSKAEAVVDAWKFVFWMPAMEAAARAKPRDISTGKCDAEAEVERLADYLLRHHASECTGPGSGVSAVDVAIRLIERAGEDRRRLTAVLAGRDEQQRMMGEVEDGLRKIASASGMIVDVYQPAHVYVSALAERVEKQLALRGPALRTDDEQIDRAALDRLTAYMRINHAHALSLGEHVADVAIWALEKYAKDHGLLCEQLGLLPVTSSSGVRAAIKGMRKDIDDASERLAKWCPECDPGKTSLRGVIVLLEVDVLKPNAEAREALERIAVASGTGECTASALAERVEQQFADFRKIADRLNTDREIAGAAEQLVRRLVDRLVETDPEYIEQLRRGGS